MSGLGITAFWVQKLCSGQSLHVGLTSLDEKTRTCSFRQSVEYFEAIRMYCRIVRESLRIGRNCKKGGNAVLDNLWSLQNVQECRIIFGPRKSVDML